jgi:L-lactate dehydrogenase complex protein LldG
MSAANGPGVDRATFLDRVRSALDRDTTTAPEETPPSVDETLIRLVEDGDDLADHFARAAVEAGMRVHRMTSAELPTRLPGLLDGMGCRAVAVAFGAAERRTVVEEAARGADCRIVDWRAGTGLDALYDADTGISDVAVAVAETGTIVMRSGPEHSRGIFVVPPVHVAVVRGSDIVADMVDLWPRLAAGDERPAATVLVTGPSKTADIEGILITGVHGPREVNIVLVDDA